jgi:hypothetical protein
MAIRFYAIDDEYYSWLVAKLDAEALKCGGCGKARVCEVPPAAAGPWQKIEDAPKDGRGLLLLDAFYVVHEASGDHPYWVEGAWIGGRWHDRAGAIAFTPTHFALVNPVPEGEQGK